MLSPLPSFFFNERRPRVSAKRSGTSIIITPDTQGGTTRSNFEIFKKKKKKNPSIFIKIHRHFCSSFPNLSIESIELFIISRFPRRAIVFFFVFFLSLSLFPPPIHSPRTTRYYESLYLFSSLNSAAMFMPQIFHIPVYIYIYIYKTILECKK